MRSVFRGYVRPSKADLSKLWDEATFSFDANVLLNLYRVSKPAADALLSAMGKLGGRVWLTHQAGAEFLRHYRDEAHKQAGVYYDVAKYLKGLGGGFGQAFPRHPYLPLDEYRRRLADLGDALAGEVEKLKAAHPQPGDDDPTLAAVLDLFDGKTRPAPTEADLKRWTDEAEKRFKAKQPPGYKDAGKGGENKYGDVLVWLQLLENAREMKKPVVFVTEDGKEDWWDISEGKKRGPRPELIQEMHDRAGVGFYLYSMSSFLERSGEKHEDRAKPDVISEVKSVERERRAAREETDDEHVGVPGREGFEQMIERLDRDAAHLMADLHRALQTARRRRDGVEAQLARALTAIQAVVADGRTDAGQDLDRCHSVKEAFENEFNRSNSVISRLESALDTVSLIARSRMYDSRGVMQMSHARKLLNSLK